MKNKKALEPLQSNIECDRVIVHNGGDFFHNHDGYELFLLLEGELNYYIEQVGSNIKRGNLVCIKPYDFHTRDVIDKNSYDRIVINIKEAYMKQ